MARPDEDPAVTHGRREALVAGLVFLISLAYTALYCYWHGFHRPPDGLKLIWGMPEWVFWGVLVPWVACWAAGGLVAALLMRDDPLGPEHELPLPGQPEPGTHMPDRAEADHA